METLTSTLVSIHEQFASPLKKLNLAQVSALIRNPSSTLCQESETLTELYQLDPRQYYREIKRLPALICPLFYPPLPNESNFLSASVVAVQFTNLHEKEIQPETLKEKLHREQSVILAWQLPSATEVIALLLLAQPIRDQHLYSVLCRALPIHLARKLHLMDHVFLPSSSIVTFRWILAHDPHPLVNPNPTPLDPFSIVDPTTLSVEKSIQQQIKQIEEKHRKQEKQLRGPDEATLRKIRALLRDTPTYRRQPFKQVYVPPALKQLMPRLMGFLKEAGLQIVYVRDIHYGQQIQVSSGTRLGEVNLYLGKKGFTVVPTTRSRVDRELSHLLARLILKFLDEHSSSHSSPEQNAHDA